MQPKTAVKTEPPREINVQFYHCHGCERVITTPLPKGLTGKHYHPACHDTAKRLSYGVLNAEVIA